MTLEIVFEKATQTIKDVTTFNYSITTNCLIYYSNKKSYTLSLKDVIGIVVMQGRGEENRNEI